MSDHQATGDPTSSSDQKADRAGPSSRASAELQNPAGGKPVRGSGVRSTIVYACQKADNAFWPIGLCIACVARQDTAGAIKLFARRRVKRSFQSAEWANARTRLVNGLGAGDVQSRGLLPSGKTHVPIPAVEWMDLQVRQRGPNEDVLHADGSFAYHDVRIAAAQMLRHWPSKTAETLVSLRPSEAAANDEKRKAGPTDRGNSCRWRARGS